MLFYSGKGHLCDRKDGSILCGTCTNKKRFVKYNRLNNLFSLLFGYLVCR